LIRLPTSYMGNPKFQFVIDGKLVETKTNCIFGYSIQNYDNGKPIKIKAKWYRNKLTLTDIKKV
jgi:hypothetical protein